MSRCLASSKFGKLFGFPSFSWGGSELKVGHFQPLAGQVQILYIFGFSELWLGRPTIHCFLIKLLFQIGYFQPLAGQGQIYIVDFKVFGAGWSLFPTG